jgi:hypothetical protein
MPGLIRNKRNSCPTGRWERERKGMVCQGLCLVAFPNTGLNFPPAVARKPHFAQAPRIDITCSGDPGNKDGHG